MSTGSRPRVLRFGVFELDTKSGELLKHGHRIKLHDKPFRVLVTLLEHPHELVTRKELQARLWPGDTFVEFENGLNNAISRLRETLGDSADSPRFIQTVPRRGYRFIAPVDKPIETPTAPIVDAPVEAPVVAAPVETPKSSPGPRSRGTWIWFALAAAAMVAMTTWLFIERRQTTASHNAQTVAVLPFEAGDSTEGSADSYVAFGMTEALITELSRVGALKVISQTSVMQYKGQRKPLKQIAAELGAGTIVEGSVLREGEQVRITVQLIDASTDTHVWAHSYGRDPNAALATQRELAREVAGIIRSHIAPADHTAAPLIEQTNAAAYEAYVKGRYFMLQPLEENVRKARDYFEQSIAADPNFAPAYVGLSHYFGTSDTIEPKEAMPRAKASALRAIELDETLASAHAALAYANYFWDWDWSEAGRRFARAIELDPNDSKTRRWHALYLSAMGNSAAAIKEVTRAIELDPVSVSAYDAAGAIYFDARQFDKMIEIAQRINELSPNDPRALGHFSTAYLYQGKVKEALDHAQRVVEVTNRFPVFLCLLAGTQHRAGLTKEAEQTLAEVNAIATKDYVPDVFLAIANLWMRGPDAAMPLLQRAYDRRDGYVVVIKSTPWFDDMRGHAGYEDIVRRLNYPR